MTPRQLTLIDCPPDAQILACRKLAKMVAANLRSFPTQDFAKRRAAMLKRTRGAS